MRRSGKWEIILITWPKHCKLSLIATPSMYTYWSVPILATRSEPAKSTSYSFPIVFFPVFLCFNQIIILNIKWDLLDDSLISVSLIVRWSKPSLRILIRLWGPSSIKFSTMMRFRFCIITYFCASWVTYRG